MSGIEQHFSSSQVCELLAISDETLRRYAQQGRILSVRIGHRRIYSESAIQAFLDGHAEHPPARVVPIGSRRQTRLSQQKEAS